MVTITVDLSHLDNLGSKMPEIKREGLKLVGLDMQGTLDKNSPTDQGVLHKWAISELTDDECKVRSPAHYTRIVNDGYSGIIKPKNGGVLAFKPTPKNSHLANGKKKYKGWAFYKSVKGQKGQHFIEKSMSEVNPRIPQHFKKAIEGVLK